jgi:hypothetical protein
MHFLFEHATLLTTIEQSTPNQILEIHTASASKTLIEEPSHMQLIMVLPSNC